MYAVVEVGGKQYRVSAGQTVRVEGLPQEVGERLELDKVLLVGGDGEFSVGNPLVSGAKVRAKVTAQGKGKKVLSFQYRPKKRYKKLRGHRQPFTQLLIESILIKGRVVSKKAAEEKPVAVKETKTAIKKAATKKPAAKKAAAPRASAKTGAAKPKEKSKTKKGSSR